MEKFIGANLSVLILVVMEEGQRLKDSLRCKMSDNEGLNPCCNGRGSKTLQTYIERMQRSCLNPCCNGRGSKTKH